jgi:hypothetical protein
MADTVSLTILTSNEVVGLTMNRSWWSHFKNLYQPHHISTKLPPSRISGLENHGRGFHLDTINGYVQRSKVNRYTVIEVGEVVVTRGSSSVGLTSFT